MFRICRTMKHMGRPRGRAGSCDLRAQERCIWNSRNRRAARIWVWVIQCEYSCCGASHADGCKTGKHITCLTLMWFAEPRRYEEKWKGARVWRTEGIRWHDGKTRRQIRAIVLSYSRVEEKRHDEKKSLRIGDLFLQYAMPKFSIRLHRQRYRIVFGGNAVTRARRRKDERPRVSIYYMRYY